MKKKLNYFQRLWNALLDRQLEEVVPMDKQLVVFLKATWSQKQLDDLLLMSAQISNQLKPNPFNPVYLQKRDRCHHDINHFQKIVLDTGFAAARIIEQDYGVQFSLVSGRALQDALKKPEQPKEDNTGQAQPEPEKSTEEKAKKLGLVIPGT